MNQSTTLPHLLLLLSAGPGGQRRAQTKDRSMCAVLDIHRESGFEMILFQGHPPIQKERTIPIPNRYKLQARSSNDEQRVQESLATLLTKAGYDVCFHEIEKISDESEHNRSAHRITLTTRPSASSSPFGVVERFPIVLRSENPPAAHMNSNRVTYQGIIYATCRSCYQLIGSGYLEANVSAAERFHHCPEMDASRGTSR
jgi:hypothetical protein